MKPKSYRKKSTRKPADYVTPSTATQSSYAVDAQAAAVLQDILSELPQLLAVAVVDIQTGRSVASHSNDPALDPTVAAVFNSEVVKQKQKSLQALQLDTERVGDILITLTDQLHLFQLTSDGQQFIYLVVDKHNTNPAMARMVLRHHIVSLQLSSAAALSA